MILQENKQTESLKFYGDVCHWAKDEDPCPKPKSKSSIGSCCWVSASRKKRKNCRRCCLFNMSRILIDIDIVRYDLQFLFLFPAEVAAATYFNCIDESKTLTFPMHCRRSSLINLSKVSIVTLRLTTFIHTYFGSAGVPQIAKQCWFRLLIPP